MKKSRSTHRYPISAKERLAICLRFLAHGSNYSSIATIFHISPFTVQVIVQNVCEAIWTSLKDSYIPKPIRADWQRISNDFENLWNFPRTLGAIDGKHFPIEKPPHSGSVYFNYKGFYSVVLLAAADAKYRFIMVDAGGAGRRSDRGLYNSSPIKEFLENPEAEIPLAEPLFQHHHRYYMPYHFLADGGFTLSNMLLTPFNRRAANTEEKKLFNYRLSRARQVVETAFGQLVTRFRLFNGTMPFAPSRCVTYILAGVVLHNYLREAEIREGRAPPLVQLEDGNESDEEELDVVPNSARVYRDRFVDFFSLEL